jgi:hypothetical protein
MIFVFQSFICFISNKYRFLINQFYFLYLFYMSEWLKIVKKHAKLNPGKSLKEYLPDAQAEYKKLKQAGKVVLKTAIEKTKKVLRKPKHKKQNAKRHTKKQRGGKKDSDDDDDDDDDDDAENNVVKNHIAENNVVKNHIAENNVAETDMEDEVVAEESEENSKQGDRRRKASGGDDIAGGRKNAPNGYHAIISMKGRTRAGGKHKSNGGKGQKGRKSLKRGRKSRDLDVTVSNMLSGAPLMMRSRTRSGGKKKRSLKTTKKKFFDIISTNLM